MRNECATGSFCSVRVVSGAPGRARSCARRHRSLRAVWRISFLRSPDPPARTRAHLRPLLVKELWEVAGGRALWTMLIVLCPLVGFSFYQALALYREASVAAAQSPVLASGLSP